MSEHPDVAWGHPQPGPGYPLGPWAPPPQNSQALVLTIMSAVGTMMCCAVTAPALIFGIVALTKQSTDPMGSARTTRHGWIAFGIGVGVAALALLAYVGLIVGLIVTAESSGSGSY